ALASALPKGPANRLIAQAEETPGILWQGDPGITETVADIMQRPAVAGDDTPPPADVEQDEEPFVPRDPGPLSDDTSRDPAPPIGPLLPQIPGTSVVGATLGESG